MAALVDSAVAQQSSHNGVDEEILNNIKELIINRTGCPPVDASHLYHFKQHMDNFPHPCPAMGDVVSGSTFPTPNPPQNIAEDLAGWEDVDSQQYPYVQAIFNHISQEDQQHAYNHFFQSLGRAPRVLEFSRFLLIYEGNDQQDTSRKTLGQLYLENAEFRETLNGHLRSMELLREMLSSKDIIIEVLGQSSADGRKKIDDLQMHKLNLQRILCTVQQEKAQLQLDHNSLRQDHDQCLSELEDERKDKQMLECRCGQLQTDKQALQSTITSQTDTITDMQVSIHEHEHNLDRLTDTIKDLKQKLHKEHNEKSSLLQKLEEKLNVVSELEEDRAIFMMENEAQGKYFLDMKGEKIRLQRENKELRESEEICRSVLAAQYEKLIQSMEVSLDKLDRNLALMTERNSHLSKTVVEQSQTISHLESKNTDLESKNSDLESKTAEQFNTISHLESTTAEQFNTISHLENKNSHLENKNSHLESTTAEQFNTISHLENKNSHLENKNSHLESTTAEQFNTISHLENKNSHLENKNQGLQQQNQGQQLFIIFLMAVIFTLICLQFSNSGSNVIS